MTRLLEDLHEWKRMGDDEERRYGRLHSSLRTVVSSGEGGVVCDGESHGGTFSGLCQVALKKTNLSEVIVATVNMCSVGVIGINVFVLVPTLLAVSETFHGKRKEGEAFQMGETVWVRAERWGDL